MLRHIDIVMHRPKLLGPCCSQRAELVSVGLASRWGGGVPFDWSPDLEFLWSRKTTQARLWQKQKEQAIIHIYIYNIQLNIPMVENSSCLYSIKM